MLNNPKKRAQNIIKKIEKGAANEADIASLDEILNKEPSLVAEIAGSLIPLLRKSDTTSFRPAISALNIAADKDIELISGSVDLIAGCLQKDLHAGELLKALEIILKIYQKHPEKMNIAVPGLLVCLRNINASVRENAYFLLGYISILHPEFFKNNIKELDMALNGLNLDGRIYACKIIKNIAEKDPKIVENAYDALSYLQSNHPSRQLRIEAEAALEKLKIKKEPVAVRKDVTEPKDNKTAVGLIALSSGRQEVHPVKLEFAGVMEPEKIGMRATGGVPGTEYTVNKKGNFNISGQVEMIVSGTDIKSPVLESVFNIAAEISREGREGKPVGTAFVIGYSKDVLAKSKQLIHNPVGSIPVKERMVTDPEFSNTIKELAQLDGAFVVSGDGVVEAACRFLIADASLVSIPKGFGTKHFSVAAMTMATKAIGIVVSESGGRITIFKEGKIFATIKP